MDNPLGALMGQSGAAGEVMGGMAKNIAWFILALFLIGGLFAFIYFFWIIPKKRYGEYSCRVHEHDQFGGLTIHKDGAGIFADSKTKGQLFRMQKFRWSCGTTKDVEDGATMQIPYYFAQQGRKYVKTVDILKEGDQFSFIHTQFSPGSITRHVGDTDINGAVDATRRIDALLKTRDLKDIAYFILAVLVIVSVVVVMNQLLKIPSALEKAGQSMEKAGSYFADASKTFNESMNFYLVTMYPSQYNQSTSIRPGGATIR